MPTIQRFIFPARTNHAVLEMPMDLDLHANVGDLLEFESIPNKDWRITQKKFKVLIDNMIEYVDYETEPA